MPTPIQSADAYAKLTSVELGDIVTLADGRELTVRAIERRLRRTAGSMTGFVLGGEVGPQATLISVPGNPDGPVVLYTPLDYIPSHARDATPVCEGVVSYWAPHLPNYSGAMGEIGYKVCAVRGQIDPMVLVWRGRERVVFIRSAVGTASDLRFLCLDRDPNATEVDVVRHAARVTQPAPIPTDVPAESLPTGGLYHKFTRAGR